MPDVAEISRASTPSPKHLRPEELHDHDHGLDWQEGARIAFVAAAAALVWFHVWEPLARVSVIGVVGTLVGIYPILKEAAENVMERRMTMELSMTIAILAALAIGQFFTALIILLFVLIAEVLEGLTVGRGRAAIKHLLDLLPRNVTIRKNGNVVHVPVENVLRGDVIEIAPGGRIPVDGEVTAGDSFVDQSAITGESLPVEKLLGSVVYAGTVNQSGSLTVRVKSIGRDTAFGRIVEAVEEAERSRAPIQKTADRLAGYLVWFALACSLLTFIITRNLVSTISVIIVAGACGIAAGTPLAILGGIGRAAREGVIIKGGLYLELLATVDTVVFDKTGTLTFGNPDIRSIDAASGHTEDEVLHVAAIAEQRSEHPLASAILKKALASGSTTPVSTDFKYRPGLGIRCKSASDEIVVGNRTLFIESGIPAMSRSNGHTASEILVAKNGVHLGTIHIADTVRPAAVKAVHELHAMGLKTVLLTGDAEAIARSVAGEVGIDVVHSGVMPEQKAQLVAGLVKSGRKVAMVGDGINDAPALMQATVGIAMGSGTEVARESANIMLIGNDLLRLVDTIKISRRCRGIIMQNFAGTLTVDAIGVGLAAFGFLNPLFAAFIHVSSELAFILNSARLLPPIGRK